MMSCWKSCRRPRTQWGCSRTWRNALKASVDWISTMLRKFLAWCQLKMKLYHLTQKSFQPKQRQVCESTFGQFSHFRCMEDYCLTCFSLYYSGYGWKVAATGGGCDDQQFEEGHHGLERGLLLHPQEPLGVGVAGTGRHLRQLHLLDFWGHGSHEGEEWTRCKQNPFAINFNFVLFNIYISIFEFADFVYKFYEYFLNNFILANCNSQEVMQQMMQSCLTVWTVYMIILTEYCNLATTGFSFLKKKMSFLNQKRGCTINVCIICWMYATK